MCFPTLFFCHEAVVTYSVGKNITFWTLMYLFYTFKMVNDTSRHYNNENHYIVLRTTQFLHFLYFPKNSSSMIKNGPPGVVVDLIRFICTVVNHENPYFIRCYNSSSQKLCQTLPSHTSHMFQSLHRSV